MNSHKLPLRTLMAGALGLALVCSIGLSARAAPTVILGPETKVQLVELFTSEGCSSCPPADSWLASLERNPNLWRRFAPIGVHVDYWDQLGWRDRFATAANTARQRNYVRVGSVRVGSVRVGSVRVGSATGVYTPGWFVDGKEWRGWFSKEPLPANASTRVGSLQLTIDGADVEVRTRAPELAQSAHRLHVALVGVGLTSEVRRGENTGRTLNHAFVALTDGAAPFMNGAGRVRLPSRMAPEMPRRRAVVAWVTANNNPSPLQVVGGWLPMPPQAAGK